MRQLALALLTLIAVDLGEVAARPPPSDEEQHLAAPVPEVSAARPTRFEWSTWLRGGVVVARTTTHGDAARALGAAEPSAIAGAMGVGFTLPIGRRVRIGPWAELRSEVGGVIGGEVTLLGTPGGLDLFWFGGTRAVTLRAGANADVRTAQLGLAYRAPWDLFGPREYGRRYVIGVGVVATATQSRDNPGEWAATLGLEVEPVGAVRYLLGIRSWY